MASAGVTAPGTLATASGAFTGQLVKLIGQPVGAYRATDKWQGGTGRCGAARRPGRETPEDRKVPAARSGHGLETHGGGFGCAGRGQASGSR